jgi:hypothetical protein
MKSFSISQAQPGLKNEGVVHGDTLLPIQQKTEIGFQTHCDFRRQVMIKHPYLSDFHSYAEYLHAGLLEGNPDVTKYVPQPYLLRISNRRYKPDCYVMSKGKATVIELKPRGEFEDRLRIPLESFFKLKGMKFEVLSNESVLDRELEALNWLTIVRVMNGAINILTDAAEYEVISILQKLEKCTLSDIVDTGDREDSYLNEIALFRLLHRGILKSDLDEKVLSYDTEVYHDHLA